MRKTTAKSVNTEKDHITQLHNKVRYIVETISNLANPTLGYDSLRADIAAITKDHENELMMSHKTIELNVDVSLNPLRPMSLVVKSGKNNTSHFHAVMQQDDRDECIKATTKELGEQNQNKR